MTALEADRPSELGLKFVMENGMIFVASHGLYDGSDDFSVISYKQIPEKIRENLIEQNLI